MRLLSHRDGQPKLGHGVGNGQCKSGISRETLWLQMKLLSHRDGQKKPGYGVGNGRRKGGI